MLGRALILAVPCVLASLPALAQTVEIKVKFDNNSNQKAIANWHNIDAGANVIATEVPAGAAIEPTAQWSAGSLEGGEKYDLSFTVSDDKKCRAVLHVTLGLNAVTGTLACTIIERENRGLSCDSASTIETAGLRKFCSATIRLDG